MDKFLGYGGIIIIVISLITLKYNLDKVNVYNFGKEVMVDIIDIPVPCNTSNKSVRPFFRFKHNNKIYSKNFEGNYCDFLKTNKSLILKTNDKNTIFVYPDERVYSEFYLNIIFIPIGGFISYKGFKKK